MAVQLISTVTRPSADIPWLPEGVTGWFLSDSHYLENWHEGSRLLSNTVEESDDKLTITNTLEFVNLIALNQFAEDPLLTPIRLARNTYMESVGIQIANMETKAV